MSKRKNLSSKDASWSGAGFAIGFAVGYLILDSLAAAILLAIGLALAMGAGSYTSTKNKRS